jgi:hypothetical protein
VTSLPSGFAVDADGGERLWFSDAEFVIRASADTTGGAFSIVEVSAPLDTALHVHERDGSIGPAVYASVSRKYGITWLDR